MELQFQFSRLVLKYCIINYLRTELTVALDNISMINNSARSANFFVLEKTRTVLRSLKCLVCKSEKYHAQTITTECLYLATSLLLVNESHSLSGFHIGFFTLTNSSVTGDFVLQVWLTLFNASSSFSATTSLNKQPWL